MNGCNKPIARIGYGYTPDTCWWYNVDVHGCIGGQSSPDWIAHFVRTVPITNKVFVEFRSGEKATFENGVEFNSNKNEGGSEMNYTVVHMNLGDSGTSPSVIKSSANLDEVKAFVEAKVAGLRGNTQVKNFFSVVVVDMKTGAVIISVVDAPPTLNWNVGTQGSLS